jgi:hypothetical protein
MNHKTNFCTAGTAALLAVSSLAACGGITQGTTSPLTYAAHGVSFRYPARWHRGTPGPAVGCCRSQELWSVAVGRGGGNAVDSVDVTANRAGQVVTTQNFRGFTPSVIRLARSQFRQLHGELTAPPHAITVGGMPGLRFAGTATTRGAAAKVTLVLAFNGSTEYGITCSSTPVKARAVQQACAQVLRTFKVGKLFKAGATLVYRVHGVSFDYPSSWLEGTVPGVPAGCGRCKSWATAVVLDPLNAVAVIATGHQPRVTRKNLPGITRFVTRAERRRFRQFGGRLLAGPRPLTVSGMPGLRYRGTGALLGTAVKATTAVLFHGPLTYEISCIFTPSKARAVNRVCAEVLRTFKATRP